MSLKHDGRYIPAILLTLGADKVEVVARPKPGKKSLKHNEVEHDCKGFLWCGPTVVSALTGTPVSTINRLIKRFRKNPSAAITATSEMELDFVFRQLGYSMEHAYLYGGKDTKSKPTLGHWLRKTAPERVQNVGYLIYLSGAKGTDKIGHWALVLDDKYICSHAPKWVPVDKAPAKRSRVEIVFAVKKV